MTAVTKATFNSSHFGEVEVTVERFPAYGGNDRPVPTDIPKDFRDALREWLDSATDENRELR